MCGPATIIGIGSAILGIASQYMQYQQAIADTEFYNAQRKLEWEGATLQAEANRSTENIRELMNDNYQGQVKALADAAYENEATGITTWQQQKQIETAQELSERELQSWQLRGSIESQGRIGLSVDSLKRDIKSQKGAADYLTSLNTAFSFMQGQQERKVSQASRGSRIASARDYIKTTFLDPVKPLEKSKPRFGPYAVGMASSVLGGISSAYSIAGYRFDQGLNPWGWGKITS